MVDFLGPANPAFARAMRKNGPMSRVRREGSRAISTKATHLRKNFENRRSQSGDRAFYSAPKGGLAGVDRVFTARGLISPGPGVFLPRKAPPMTDQATMPANFDHPHLHGLGRAVMPGDSSP